MKGICRDCALELFGEDTQDFAGMVNPALVAEGYGLLIECDRCGPALVDVDGRRLETALSNA